MASVARRCWQMYAGVLIGFTLFQSGYSLVCYICGGSGLQAPGECSTHFQYDCTHYAKRLPANETIYCRTLRRLADDGTYTALKECIGQSEHHRTYPGAVTDGCETLFAGTDYEVAYCLCKSNFCNELPLHQQLARFAAGLDTRMTGGGQVSVSASVPNLHPDQPTAPPEEPHMSAEQPNAATDFFGAPITDEQSPSTATLPASHAPFDGSKKQKETVPPALFDGAIDYSDLEFDYYSGRTQPKHLSSLPDEQLPLDTVSPFITASQPLESRPSSSNVSATDRPMHFGEQPTAATTKGLVCMVCGQGNLAREQPECAQQYAVDCAAQYEPGSKVHCFTRHTLLTNGKSAIEKLCVTNEALRQEYGEATVDTGCAQAWEKQVEYCVCSASMCNEQPILLQQAAYNDKQEQLQPQFAVEESSRLCYVCGESDLDSPGDCGLAYEYDCGRQYPGRTDVHCLTRLSRMANELYTIEKRCILAEEHMKQYPESEAVLMSGCGSAYDGSVEYCICDSDYCNAGNMSAQRAQHNASHSMPVQHKFVHTEYPAPIAYTSSTASTPRAPPSTSTTSSSSISTTTSSSTRGAAAPAASPPAPAPAAPPATSRTVVPPRQTHAPVATTSTSTQSSSTRSTTSEATKKPAEPAESELLKGEETDNGSEASSNVSNVFVIASALLTLMHALYTARFNHARL